jgi:hypothetical protein
MRFADFTLRIRRSATGQSCASPPVNRMAMRRPLASASAWIFVLRPSRERPTACFCSPFSDRCRAVRFDVCGVDHLRTCGSSVPSKLLEQVFRDATPCPAYEAVIDRRWTISFRAIAPVAAAPEHLHDPVDPASVVGALDATHSFRQMRLSSSILPQYESISYCSNRKINEF